jgi:hypothetical protein
LGIAGGSINSSAGLFGGVPVCSVHVGFLIVGLLILQPMLQSHACIVSVSLIVPATAVYENMPFYRIENASGEICDTVDLCRS